MSEGLGVPLAGGELDEFVGNPVALLGGKDGPGGGVAVTVTRITDGPDGPVTVEKDTVRDPLPLLGVAGGDAAVSELTEALLGLLLEGGDVEFPGSPVALLGGGDEGGAAVTVTKMTDVKGLVINVGVRTTDPLVTGGGNGELGPESLGIPLVPLAGGVAEELEGSPVALLGGSGVGPGGVTVTITTEVNGEVRAVEVDRMTVGDDEPGSLGAVELTNGADVETLGEPDGGVGLGGKTVTTTTDVNGLVMVEFDRVGMNSDDKVIEGVDGGTVVSLTVVNVVTGPVLGFRSDPEPVTEVSVGTTELSKN